MTSLGKALWRVVVRLLISTAVLFLVIAFAFLNALVGPGDSRWLVAFALYLLIAWTLMPLVFLNIATKAIASVVWIGAGIHAYAYIAPGTSPKLFPNWVAATLTIVVLLAMRFLLSSLEQQSETTTLVGAINTDDPLTGRADSQKAFATIALDQSGPDVQCSNCGKVTQKADPTCIWCHRSHSNDEHRIA